jgi:SAM-dependent methyltransferase
MTSGEWDARYGERGLLWTAEPNRFLVSELEGMAPGRALDLACGEGRNAVWLATTGWTVTGVDFSPVGVDKARRLADQLGVNVELVVADLAEWEASASYDLVLVLYLQVGPDARRRALAAASRALAPGGTLLVIGHALRNLTDGYGGPPTADVLYAPDDIVADLGSLTVEKADEVLRPVDVDGVTHTAIDVLVRARR